METLKSNISEAYKTQADSLKDSESDFLDKNDMKGKANDLDRLHQASYPEQIQILTLVLECTVQNILMSLNTLTELYMKAKK